MYELTNYQIVFFNGNRRCYRNNNGNKSIEFAGKHIEYINENIPNIGLVSFIINKGIEELDNELIEFINESNLNFNYEIIVRPNQGFSYGAWAETMVKNHIDFDYTFVIEDDYIPTQKDTLDYFYNKLDEKTIFVCCLWVNDHASISNGMIYTKLMRGDNINTLKKYHGSSYADGQTNQRYFMTEYKKLNFNFKDICDVAHTIFRDNNKKNKFYGDRKKPLIITPI